MNRLLIMYCPYCGSKDVHELQRAEDVELESVIACCLSCDEQFVIDRDVKYQLRSELLLEKEQEDS